jgi:oxygen-independent coproporphyrinogen-3 oxidase
MAFGIYVHIPYCLQICSYCDFTKYEIGKILPPEDYVSLVIKEIQQRADDVPEKIYDTIYFGGGTPSLLKPQLILSILDALAKAGFQPRHGTASNERVPEITIEIDPATVNEARLDSYLEMGINRFSVGAQSFNDRILKLAGRKHTAQDTVELLSLLSRSNVNYSFDLLFALPKQTLAELEADISTALHFSPQHLSAYYLTVPEGHKLSVDRGPEDDQIEMFDRIETGLKRGGLERYEISNFAKPGFESKHNLLYWQDQPYWGLGLSSHSYFPRGSAHGTKTPWGLRFWNVRALKVYGEHLEKPLQAPWRFETGLGNEQFEMLEKHQSLTDYCHTSLRIHAGLDMNALRLKFGEKTALLVESRLLDLRQPPTPLVRSFASTSGSGKKAFGLTHEGQNVSNLVFAKLTFLKEEIDGSAN